MIRVPPFWSDLRTAFTGHRRLSWFRWRRSAWLVVLPISLAGAGQQAPPAAAPHPFTLSVQVNLVPLSVRVTGRHGDVVNGLRASDFSVYEDGHPQKITLFEQQDVPVTVGLVVDESSSMFHLRPDVVQAVHRFTQLSNRGDQIFVVNFSDQAALGLPPGVPFSSNPEVLTRALASQAGGLTALYDAIALGVHHAAMGSSQRKALILISDGGDTASHLTRQAALRLAAASGVQIYTIGFFDPTEFDESPKVLEEFAKATGGKAYTPTSSQQLSQVCATIARDLREQYLLGYRANCGPGTPRRRHLRVVVTAPHEHHLHVSARSTLVCPASS